MPYVLTVDQRRSRRSVDRVDAALATLASVPTVLAFERTAGDEFQGVLADPVSVVDVMLHLVSDAHWHIGVGVGPVQHPLPASTRAAHGPAFELAREAVEAAKRRPQHLAVRALDPVAAADAEAVLALIAATVSRRSKQAIEAVDLVGSGLTTTQAAARLGISRQAVGQRLSAGLWHEERDVRPAAARLLERCASCDRGDG